MDNPDGNLDADNDDWRSTLGMCFSSEGLFGR